MMGTLATLLAGKKILTREDLYRANVEGDIENIDGVLKITAIRVKYHLKVPRGRSGDVQEALSTYLVRCPAAQTLIGCVNITDNLEIEEIEAYH